MCSRCSDRENKIQQTRNLLIGMLFLIKRLNLTKKIPAFPSIANAAHRLP
jgi:hypothetical protein